MTGGYIFSLSTLAGGGGTPSQVWVGGYPISGLGKGYPIPGLGRGYPPWTRSGWGTPNQVWMMGGYLEYPLLTRSGWGTPLDLGRGTPLDLGQGTPLTRSGWGTHLDLGWGTPQTWDGVPPPPKPGTGYPRIWDGVPPPDHVWIRQSSTANTCGRCASCVHTGGLSCDLKEQNYFPLTVAVITPIHWGILWCLPATTPRLAFFKLDSIVTTVKTFSRRYIAFLVAHFGRICEKIVIWKNCHMLWTFRRFVWWIIWAMCDVKFEDFKFLRTHRIGNKGNIGIRGSNIWKKKQTKKLAIIYYPNGYYKPGTSAIQA